ncbi:MAG TPA: DoxX family membrane protein [Phycisphaerae bacterium]|nr:DoxX family membrane protein [Phycisphaerae bacterium]
MSEHLKAQSPARLSSLQMSMLILLRLAVGWHLLYEGAGKLMAPGWSAEGYLSHSNWILAPLFRWMAADPGRLRVIDALNIWGLILIGLALLLGVMPRLASLGGAVLLLLYYAAISPLYGPGVFGAESDYFGVSKVLIEAIALLTLAAMPSGSMFRLDRLVAGFIRPRHPGRVGSGGMGPSGDETVESQSRSSLHRREILGSLASLPLVGLFCAGLYQRRRRDRAVVQAITGATIKVPTADLSKLKGKPPMGQIGSLKISRLMLGSNLIGGWAHSRDLIYVSSLFKAYNTEWRIMHTLALAEKAGINMINCVNPQLALIDKYRRQTGGAMQTMCQIRTVQGDMKTEIDMAIDAGATTMYIQGAVGDKCVEEKRLEELADAVAYGRRQGYLVGIGAHSIRVPIACEEAGIESDYYVKTFHHDRYWSAIPRERRQEFSVDRERHLDHDMFHDNIFDLFPEQTAEFMAGVDKPFVAFKVLAGGAIPPEDGFRFAFENGADFICVGMFDFQIVDDVNISLDVLADMSRRTRPWRA